MRCHTHISHTILNLGTTTRRQPSGPTDLATAVSQESTVNSSLDTINLSKCLNPIDDPEDPDPDPHPEIPEIDPPTFSDGAAHLGVVSSSL